MNPANKEQVICTYFNALHYYCLFKLFLYLCLPIW